jgi:tetratricopeptide (TPR) repeat protein
MVPAVCLVLAALVWTIFGQAAGFEFVNYDDTDNVSTNAHVAAGLNWTGIAWAFTHGQLGRWAPLVTISHMADCQFFGLWAGGHHLTNVVLHAATALLLFLALREMTGALWRSAFVAAVFAIHPLRAEVVGWVSSRGEVLGGLFFMLTLLAYARYARRPGSRAWYWAVAAFFALGLMCKPSVVTLPCVLLLLDYWPLDRFAKSGVKELFHIPARLIVEKIPLFALAILSCAAALVAQHGTEVPVEKMPLLPRIANALVSCAVYAWQMIYPAGLAVFYPYPKGGPAVWETVAALLLLGMVSSAVYAGRRRFRYAATGWCWYLGMLLPVLGIIETGAQAHADRYTYLPQIGLYLLVTWGIADLSAKWDGRREIMGVGAAVAITLLALSGRDQMSTWGDSVTLWSNAVERTGPNSLAQNNLGNALLQKGRVDEALDHLRKALEIEPDLADAYVSLGNALVQKGRTDEAIAQYRRALELQPGLVKAHTNLGVAYQQAGRTDEAIAQYQQALDLDPGLAAAHNNLGVALQQTGRLNEAIAHFQKALELQPGYEGARDNLTGALRQKEQTDGGNAP